MASATGIPSSIAGDPDANRENEPLLGRSEEEAPSPVYHNFFGGYAIPAQLGILLLFTSVWASVFLSPLIFFSAHPLLNSTAALLLTESIIVLQPTATAGQKRAGTLVHATLNGTAAATLLAGLAVIEKNKFAHGGTHFVSPHAILGLLTYILIALQALVGATVYFFPALYGGLDNAKRLYKWHRVSGYFVLILLLTTLIAATRTDYNLNVLAIKLWAVIISAVLIVAGIAARVQWAKLGLIRS